MNENNLKTKILGIAHLALLCVVLANLSLPDDNLHIVACDVGQGDALLLYKGATQIVIDGGPNNSILTCLGKYMPFWDRKIEAVFLTHPQKDHYQGLLGIEEQYDVDKFFASDLTAQAQDYNKLMDMVSKKSERLFPRRGELILIKNIKINILWPTQEYVDEFKSTSIDPNNFSTVLALHYGDFDAIFTGDLPPDVEDQLVAQNLISEVEYLKIPHHGSRNGLNQTFLDATDPKVAVVSSGNQYGHPHQEIIDMLTKKDVKIERTDQLGNIEVISDGRRWWLR
jgi:competence protein ComEC